MAAVKSEILIDFFSHLGSGGVLVPHRHLGCLDKDFNLNLGRQKYSLVYYLSIGDQNCNELNILKPCNFSEDILPYEGMIMIFPQLDNTLQFMVGRQIEL